MCIVIHKATWLENYLLAAKHDIKQKKSSNIHLPQIYN